MLCLVLSSDWLLQVWSVIWLLCFRSARWGEGAHKCVYLWSRMSCYQGGVWGSSSYQRLLNHQGLSVLGAALATFSLFPVLLFSSGTDFPHPSLLGWDGFEFLENFKPKMSSWCPHTTINLWLLDEFSVKQGRCSVTLLGKRSFCLQPVCRIAGVWVVIWVLSWLLDKQTLHRPAFGCVYICTVMIYT